MRAHRMGAQHSTAQQERGRCPYCDTARQDGQDCHKSVHCLILNVSVKACNTLACALGFAGGISHPEG